MAYQSFQDTPFIPSTIIDNYFPLVIKSPRNAPLHYTSCQTLAAIASHKKWRQQLLLSPNPLPNPCFVALLCLIKQNPFRSSGFQLRNLIFLDQRIKLCQRPWLNWSEYLFLELVMVVTVKKVQDLFSKEMLFMGLISFKVCSWLVDWKPLSIAWFVFFSVRLLPLSRDFNLRNLSCFFFFLHDFMSLFNNHYDLMCSESLQI